MSCTCEKDTQALKIQGSNGSLAVVIHPYHMPWAVSQVSHANFTYSFED